MRKATGKGKGERVISRKRWLVFLLLVLLSLGLSGGVRVRAAEHSGTCGRKVEWSFDSSDGVLRIKGSGAMYDYADPNRVPWYKFRNEVRTVDIGKGVTSVGGGAFFSCQNLQSVQMPDSVTAIGDNAFVQCRSLSKIWIPDSVTAIGSCAFQDTGLRTAEIPKGVRALGKALFCDCAALTTVKLPEGLRTIEAHAFYNCANLKEVWIPGSVSSLGEGSFHGVRAVLQVGCCQFSADMLRKAEVENYELVHAWREPMYAWSSDYGTVLAVRACSSDSSHDVTETVQTSYSVTRQPTCREKGETTYTATFRSSLFTKQTRTVANIDALGHDMKHLHEIPAGCEQPGRIECYRCARCKSYYADAEGTRELTQQATVKPAIGHKYEATVTREPACEVCGIRTYVCAHDPSHRYEEEIPALGHQYEASVTREPTCTEEGVTTFLCARDHAHVYTEPIPVLGHDLTHLDRVEPTEEADGSVECWHCARCGKYYADEACAHELSELERILPRDVKAYISSVEKAPTCTEPGILRFVNEADETDTYTEAIPPLGHALFHVDRMEPTPKEEGHIAYWQCRACGRLFEDAGAVSEISREMTVLPRTGMDRVTLIFGAAGAGMLLFFMMLASLTDRKKERGKKRR